MPGISLGLSRINWLLSLLSSPHVAVPVIHVAGTNGKGSVCSYVSSVLNAASFRASTFNSPHLVDAWDCIKLSNDQPIAEREYNEARAAVHHANDTHGVKATSFELLTATAFVAFARARARDELDVAVVEVGMGGETDATNVVPAGQTLLSILTPVSLDHQKFLGDTVGEIAAVKAGIIKERTDVVLAKQEYDEARTVITNKAHAMNATLHDAATYRFQSPLTLINSLLDERAGYQRDNALTALVALDVLRHSARALKMLPALSKLTDEHVKRGMEDTTWDGRLSRLTVQHPDDPTQQVRLLIDGAHNAASIEALARYITSLPVAQRPRTLLTALSSPRSPTLLDPLLRLRLDSTSESGPSEATAPATALFEKVVAFGFDRPEGMEWVSCVEPSKIASHVRQAYECVAYVDSRATFEEALACAVPTSSSSSTADGTGGEEHDREVLVAGSLYGISQVYQYARRRT